MAKDIRPLRADIDNTEWFNAIRNHSGLDLQSRVPAATQASLEENINKVFDFAPDRNAFINGLVNRIGLTLFSNSIWTNPLAVLKHGTLDYGETIQEVITGFIKASVYDANRDELEREIFGAMTPEVSVAYHQMDRQDKYKLTVKPNELRLAFLRPNGVSSFVSALMGMPQKSDQYDEYMLMMSVFKLLDKNSPLFTVNSADLSLATSDADDARFILKGMQTYSNLFRFPSRDYNAGAMPAFANPNELVVFLTAEADAAMNVDALASTFQLPKAEFESRKFVVPGNDIGIPGTQAILTTDKAILAVDNLIEVTSIQNPANMQMNYWLHHWETISASPYAPMVIWNSERETTVISGDVPAATAIGALTVVNGDGEEIAVSQVETEPGTEAEGYALERGKLYNFMVEATSTSSDKSVTYEFTGAESNVTTINNNGSAFISPDESSDVIILTVTSTDNEEISKSFPIALTGDVTSPWRKDNK